MCTHVSSQSRRSSSASFGEHVSSPSVEAVLDDAKGRVQRIYERIGAEHVLEIVVARAVVRSVRERRGLGARFTGEVAEPKHPLTAACPAVAHIGHLSGEGRIANCSFVIAATTSRKRWL
jgi:hypothetical protein